jgi:hypothetical protein
VLEGHKIPKFVKQPFVSRIVAVPAGLLQDVGTLRYVLVSNTEQEHGLAYESVDV